MQKNCKKLKEKKIFTKKFFGEKIGKKLKFFLERNFQKANFGKESQEEMFGKSSAVLGVNLN